MSIYTLIGVEDHDGNNPIDKTHYIINDDAVVYQDASSNFSENGLNLFFNFRS